MPFDFKVGEKYRRRDVYRIIGVDEDTHGGNWDTGYNRLNDDWFIFCNIGDAGRTGHDYANAWSGSNLIWFGKTKTKIHQPAIKHITGQRGDTYLFYRNSNQDAFTYAGRATALEVEDVSPVKVIWQFSP